MSTPEILQGLMDLLKDNKWDVRQAAAQALGELNAPTPETLQGLVAWLKDIDPDVRQAAARVLGELKEPSPEILQDLVALLKHYDGNGRQAAVRALGKLKAQAPEILPALVALLKNEKWRDRQAAAQALGELNAPTPETLQGLVALLKDNDHEVRKAATEAFRHFSTTSILQLYFQTSCQWYQSSLQEWLLTFIGQRWLVNRQVVKIVNQQVFWLEQGQWQQLPIPSNHPHFQYYVKKTMEELVGSRLSLTFAVSTVENLGFFSQDPPSSSPSPQFEPTAVHKQPQHN